MNRHATMAASAFTGSARSQIRDNGNNLTAELAMDGYQATALTMPVSFGGIFWRASLRSAHPTEGHINVD